MSRARDRRRQRASAVEAARLVLGGLHLVRAGAAPRTAVFYRVLGVRQLAQAALLLRARSGDAHTLGAAVDATHAVTMLPLMLVGGQWRRVATSQFWIATALAVAEVTLVGTGRKR
ncbi:hypothetical protein EDF24_0658 [Curtobacterium sp. PhB130]|uniref:hypothetical protein n=1 Tax=unclassified Curtobacterium TaxID=257496 RepID=UPI000F4D0200|nr:MULTISPECIES: hypothetical protein [unclassified Curtobacterium]ROP63633.1 hypothetical protein EDF55_2393 [Curtobacterium sp. ZW137]ROS77893.1 hypothetical protein EDF24_0658 [Curtobacterium sp. PhB130]TCK65894.1 hypothetical protein EDF27_0642 [Curtobacterium sp. PhB136]